MRDNEIRPVWSTSTGHDPVDHRPAQKRDIRRATATYTPSEILAKCPGCGRVVDVLPDGSLIAHKLKRAIPCNHSGAPATTFV